MGSGQKKVNLVVWATSGYSFCTKYHFQLHTKSHNSLNNQILSVRYRHLQASNTLELSVYLQHKRNSEKLYFGEIFFRSAQFVISESTTNDPKLLLCMTTATTSKDFFPSEVDFSFVLCFKHSE